MGISTGFCTVGNFGSDLRLDYTVLGSPVNLAARLQTTAEHNTILIDEFTITVLGVIPLVMPVSFNQQSHYFFCVS